MQLVVVIGAGGLAAEVLEVLDLIQPNSDLMVISDPPVPHHEAPFIRDHWRGGTDVLTKLPPEFEYVVAIGDSVARRRLSEEALRHGGREIAVIHPNASVGPSCSLGPGVILLAGASVTAIASVGRGAILNPGARVSHHCVVGEFATIGPNAVLCGRAQVGDGVLVGAGSVLNPGVTVSSRVAVGVGALVVADIDGPGTWTGVPARRLTG